MRSGFAFVAESNLQGARLGHQRYKKIQYTCKQALRDQHQGEHLLIIFTSRDDVARKE